MEAARKSYEIQAKVRHNSEDFKNSINDLYNWQKEIKEKERNLSAESVDVTSTLQETMTNAIPIRSHVLEKNNSTTSPAKPPDNKLENSNGQEDQEEMWSLENSVNNQVTTIEMNRKTANDMKDSGNKHVRLGEFQLAAEEYTKAIDLYPWDPIFYTNRALCYLKMELYHKCIEDCDCAINMEKLAVKAYYRRMLANENLGNNMEALKDCFNILEIEPNNTEVKRCLTRINDRLIKYCKKGPNFTELDETMVELAAIKKSPYQQSQKPLRRVPISDVIGPIDYKNYESLQISDEDIDKIFNSNCGSFEEIKKTNGSDDHADLQSTNLNGITNINTTATTTAATSLNETTTVDNSSTTATTTKLANGRDEEILEAKFEKSPTSTPNNLDVHDPIAPTSTAQFYAQWKELNAKQRYLCLKSIPLKQLNKILGAGFDSETLSDIICTIQDYYLPEQDATTAETLLEISKNKQMIILSLLLAANERKALIDIINVIKEKHNTSQEMVEQIMENLNLY